MIAMSILLLSCSLPRADAQGALDQVVILVDSSHNPQFAANDNENGLKLLFDMVNASTRYIVRVHSGSLINETILEDIDCLIVASPDRTNTFQSSEIAAISEMLENGTSMLVLGDPSIDQRSEYWTDQTFQDLGDNIAVNRFLNALNISAVRFSINQTGGDTYWGDTVFDYDHALNDTLPYVIRFDATTWDPSHPIFKDINELVVMTATLRPINSSTILARGYDSSFAQFRRGPNSFANITFPNMSLENFTENYTLSYSTINGTFPGWLSAFQYGASRIIVSGSTLMFTGRTLDLPSPDPRTSLEWFYIADNSRFFMNMLNWLTEGFVEPPGAILAMSAISGAILVLGVVYYLFKKTGRTLTASPRGSGETS
jgi:hypothetical protein